MLPHIDPIAKAEVTYPAEESVTGGILTFCINAGGLVLLVVLPSIPDSYNSLVMGFAVVFGTAVLIFVRVRYKRSEADEKRLGGSWRSYLFYKPQRDSGVTDRT